MSEHSLRYDELADFLTQTGIAVYADDHLGHGKTFEKNGELGYFADKDGWNIIVSDLESVRRLSKREYPALPATLLGHSMGSFMARTHMIKYPGAFDFYILSGTGHTPAAVVRLGRRLARLEAARKGGKYRSENMNRRCFGAFNRRFKCEFDWLCHDRERLDKYRDDKLCGFVFTLSGFIDLFDGLEFISNADNLKKIPAKTGVLLISGGDDPVGGRGKGVAHVAKLLKKAGAGVHVKLYPGLRHELLNEFERAEVMEFIRTKIPTV
jgi:alpha-beta hydrolase superfamily lysophospholipase